MPKRLVLLGAAVLAATITIGVASATPRPSSYVLPGDAVFPEGIAYQPLTGRFFVSATGDGTIFRGHLFDPTAEVFLPGGADGRTTAIGVHVDLRGRLYVAGGATGRIWVYSTRTKQLLGAFDTGAGGFLNDVIVTLDGTAYVTDSLRPVLWRIPADLSRVEHWLDLPGYQPGFNANGIDASLTGRWLVVAQSNTGTLWRIDVPSKQVTAIDLGGEQVAADGIELVGRTLFAVARPDLIKVRMSLDLRRGDVVSRTTDPTLRFPTTLAVTPGRLLVVNSQFDRRGPGLTPELPFTVSSVPVP
jgi:Cu-Zn family superoxide dismutase